MENRVPEVEQDVSASARVEAEVWKIVSEVFVKMVVGMSEYWILEMVIVYRLMLL